jgi:hypothetical protein
MIPAGKTSAAFAARAISHELDDIWLALAQRKISKTRFAELINQIRNLSFRANVLATALGPFVIDEMSE